LGRLEGGNSLPQLEQTAKPTERVSVSIICNANAPGSAGKSPISTSKRLRRRL
jgi:hypothetical protein